MRPLGIFRSTDQLQLPARLLQYSLLSMGRCSSQERRDSFSTLRVETISRQCFNLHHQFHPSQQHSPLSMIRFYGKTVLSLVEVFVSAWIFHRNRSMFYIKHSHHRGVSLSTFLTSISQALNVLCHHPVAQHQKLPAPAVFLAVFLASLQ